MAAAMRGFSCSGPEVQVLTCPLPFLRGRLNFRPNIPQPDFFWSSSLRIHQNFKQFNVHARKKSTSNNEENTETDWEKTKKKRGRPKKSMKETSEKEEITVQITSDLNQEQNLEEPLQSEETKDRTSEKEETFVQFTSDLNQTENSEETKDPPPPPKISQKFLDQITKYDTSLIEPSTKHEELIAQILNLCEPSRDDTWRPLIGCFGPAKLSFIPYAKPATRVIDKELQQHYPFNYWSPARFFRAAGSSADRVAVQLARAGQKVDFVGKLGEDMVGSQLLDAMMRAGVEMRQVARCNRLSTAVSRMKVRVDKSDGGLRAECVKKCAEDSFGKDDVKEIYMKRVKMLYFTSWALLDPDLQSSLLRSIHITKSHNNQTFFDLNLPLPLWHLPPSELKTLLKPFFELANFVELTSQELKYLLEIKYDDEKEGYRTCGFDKKEQDEVYGHVEREKVMEEFWHEGMKALFVTDGASRVHYYTCEFDGFVRGDENIGLEPASKEMAAAGDALVAAIIKMLVREQEDPDSVLDPKYLEDNLTNASLEAAIAQFGVSQISGFYNDSLSDEEEETEEEKVEESEKEKVEVFGGALYD